MSNYFIKYKNLAIHFESNHKLSGHSHPVFKVIPMRSEDDFEMLRRISPYANCVKMDLHEQLTSNNLSRTLPRYIKDIILSLPEVKSIMREDKIKSILEDE